MDAKTVMKLAARIARHEAPVKRKPVDKKLLAKSADRLLRVSEDVLLAMPVSDKVN